MWKSKFISRSPRCFIIKFMMWRCSTFTPASWITHSCAMFSPLCMWTIPPPRTHFYTFLFPLRTAHDENAYFLLDLLISAYIALLKFYLLLLLLLFWSPLNTHIWITCQAFSVFVRFYTYPHSVLITLNCLIPFLPNPQTNKTLDIRGYICNMANTNEAYINLNNTFRDSTLEANVHIKNIV